MSAHATTSASSLHRRVRCPGSHLAEHGLAEPPESEYAEEGTRLHAALHTEAKLTAKERDLAESVKELFAEAIEQAVAQFSIPADAQFTEGYEKPLRIKKGIRTVLPGTCDRWRYYPVEKILIIEDAKFCFLEVTPAPLNLQLRAYAVMGSQEWDVDQCIVGIAQPRAGMLGEGERLTIARYDRADLALAYEQILEWEKAWLAPDAPRHPGEDACKYCRAQLTCDAYTSRLSLVKTNGLLGIADLTTKQWAAMWEGFEVATNKEFQERMKAEMRLRISEGRAPGYEMKENAPRRSVTDNVAASQLLMDELGFTVEEVAAASSLSLGEGVAVLRRKVKLSEKEATEQIRTALAPVIELKTPQPSIVRRKVASPMLSDEM